MIKQQLELWRDFYKDKVIAYNSYTEEIKSEMEDILFQNNLQEPKSSILNTSTSLISLSIEFNQYQTTQKIGTHLQQLIDYPFIYRYNLLKKTIKNNQGEIKTINKK